MAGHLQLVGESPGPHSPDGVQHAVHPAGESGGEQQRDQDDRQLQQHRDLQKIPLQGRDERALVRIVGHEIDRAHGGVVIKHRRGGVALDSFAGILAVENVVALQRLHDLGQEEIHLLALPLGPRVVDHPPTGVRDDDAGGAQVRQDLHRLGDPLLGQLIQPRQGRGHELRLILHRRRVGPEHQVPGRNGGNEVQQPQRHRRNEYIKRRMLGLGRAGQQPPEAAAISLLML